MDQQRGPLEEPAGEWFVNRREELAFLWKWTTSIPDRVIGSVALIGLRRTGKTAILHKTFNRLFNEQTRVLPVYPSHCCLANRKRLCCHHSLVFQQGWLYPSGATTTQA